MLNLSDVFADRMRIKKAKREQEYFESVHYIAQNNIEPSHGPYGSNMGMGVSGYVLKGRPGVVFVKDEDVLKAREQLEMEKLDSFES